MQVGRIHGSIMQRQTLVQVQPSAVLQLHSGRGQLYCMYILRSLLPPCLTFIGIQSQDCVSRLWRNYAVSPVLRVSLENILFLTVFMFLKVRPWWLSLQRRRGKEHHSGAKGLSCPNQEVWQGQTRVEIRHKEILNKVAAILCFPV